MAKSRFIDASEFGNVPTGARAVGIAAAYPLEQLRGVFTGRGSPTFEQVDKLLSDPVRVRSCLAELAPLALVALEIVAELGTAVRVAIVTREIQRRTGAAQELARLALVDAEAASLIVQTGSADGDREIWLIDRAAETVARAVRGISLPALPSAEAASSSEPRMPRELHRLAFLAHLAHRPVRPSRHGTVHGGTVRSIAKAIHADERQLDEWIGDALQRNVVGTRGRRIAPTFESLQADAGRQPRRDRHWLVDQVIDWIPSEGWVSLEALARAHLRGEPARGSKDAERVVRVVNVLDAAKDLQNLATALAGVPGIELRRAEGELFVRRIAALARGGDGYVNPSFEVIVGPACPPDGMAAIGLGCELKRLDNVITFRVTPASVANGVACGLDAETLLAALRVASKHPVPDNVEHSIRDWASRTKVVRIERRLIVTAAADVLDRLQQGIDACHAPARLGPEALALDPETPMDLLEGLVDKTKAVIASAPAPRSGRSYHWSHDDDNEDEDWGEDIVPLSAMDPDPAASRTAPLPCPLPLSFQGPPALRERLARDRASKFSLTRRALDEGDLSPDVPGYAESLCAECGGVHDEDPDDHFDDEDDEEGDGWRGVLAHVLRRAMPELTAWVDRVLPLQRGKAPAMHPEQLLRFACLSEKGRRKVLERSHSLEQLCQRVDASDSFSDMGRSVLQDFHAVPGAQDDLVDVLHRIAGVPPPPRDGASEAMRLIGRANGAAAAAAPVLLAAASTPAAQLPPPAPIAPANVLRKKDVLIKWMRQRVRGQSAWLEIATSEGTLRGTFQIDAVQPRGAEVALLVSSEAMERGRVVYASDLVGAADIIA